MMGDLTKTSTWPPAQTSKSHCRKEKKQLRKRLAELQEKLFAANRSSLLVILQGMDASGKDNAVKHIFSGVNPSGCRVKSFKVPSAEEYAHHFLWRVSKECPEKRYIQIFNRSHYDHVVENMIAGEMGRHEADVCLEEIDAFEKGLHLHGTTVLKFYLHVSSAAQQKRYRKRTEDPDKHWKLDEADRRSVERYDEYRQVYEHILDKPHEIAWHVIPADKKWYKNYLILKIVVEAMERLAGDNPKHPGHVEEG